ncbi:hypothetical protein BGZ80_008285 [Entomortierella chlamydospora]|uniref:Phosphatidylglycerol/phosphatidylinositol transfer protein n=1 Tax=Entomortierella chlamydospora TaxID=101097 RepID=A0A9P6MXE4_9FUNG|nr:hypothetical protein BGZ79_003799 [Entomortierella chlamydospora]KAG0017443.1 hypothetical protein BGZ80_008285 [Entomortierella chlamydospora]
MKFSTVFATFSSILLASAVTGAKTKFGSCGSSDVMTFKSAQVPAVKAGEKACGSVTGSLSQPLTGGQVTITATYMGFTVHQETKDVCADSACPLDEGKHTILVCFNVPDNTPDNLTIDVKVSATNQNSAALFCAEGMVVTQGKN